MVVAVVAMVVAVAVALALAGCGGGGDGNGDGNGDGGDVGYVKPAPPPAAVPPPPPEPAPARCPATAANCRSADGTILYVERVDPDGDGDAHFVLVSDEGVTAPGISVIDVRRELRPRPLPGPGDEVSAAGPVYRGSHGQRQIQADVIHVAE